MHNSSFELWLDTAALNYSEFSFLSFACTNPTQNFADTVMFFNKAPKEDTFEGRVDLSLGLRVIVNEQQAYFTFQQPNTSITGKVTNIKCRGGKITQANLMMDWIDLLSTDTYDKSELLRYPIEGKYKLHHAGLDTQSLIRTIISLADFTSYNPAFLGKEVSRILSDKRFWARAKLTISGLLPTSCYLPSASQEVPR
jgi:hypothetical protein